MISSTPILSTVPTAQCDCGTCRRASEHTLEGHSGDVTSVVFSPDGSRVASSSDDKTVQVWDVGSTTELLRYDIGTYDHTMKFSDDSTKIVVDGAPLSILSQTPLPSTTAGLPRPHSDVPVSRLGVSDDWVTLSSEKILWLPPEYRPGTFASHRDTVVIGWSSHICSLRCDAFVTIAVAFGREEVIGNNFLRPNLSKAS